MISSWLNNEQLNHANLSGCRKLVGTSNLWRICVGDYRVVYSIEDDVLVIEVIAVRHRRDAYKY